jgi:RNA polymerase-binding transcription factor DksA
MAAIAAARLQLTTGEGRVKRTITTMYEDIAKTLAARLAELSGHIAEIDEELRSALPADWEEQATQLEGQDALEGIEKQKLKEIQQIRAALQRIEDGRYGVCAKCGEDIDPKRLKALPTAIFCLSCVG